METYLEYNDGSSHKFWQIKIEGPAHTVTYGKIGTDGQKKTKNFDTPEAALKDGEKLIKSKIKKGYKETTKRSGKYKKVYVSYDESEEKVTLAGKLEKLAETEEAAEISFLSLGAWEEPWDCGCDDALKVLIRNKASFPNVTGMFIGDMNFEECEISWIIQTDLTPLLLAFPALEELYVRGSSNLQFTSMAHSSLKKLVIECGGLSKSTLNQIAAANLPRLEHLELYLGEENYGFDGDIKDIKPFLEKGRFPSLTYLGLSDSVLADDIAELAANADVLEQLDTLDLSKGTLGDRGAKALLAGKKTQLLKKLDLHHHYMSDKVVNQLKKLEGVEVDTSDAEGEQPEEDRYIEVSE